MPKIRDLGISTIPFARATDTGSRVNGYLMCQPTIGDPEGAMEEECHPTPPQCHPTPNPPPPPCHPTPEGDRKEKKDTRGLPHDAVIQLKQQLQQQISRQLHS